MSLTFIFSTLVLFIISLIKKNSKPKRMILSSFGVLITSSCILFSSLHSTINLYNVVNVTASKKGLSLQESYEGFKEDEALFDLLEDASILLDGEFAIFDTLKYPAVVVSLGKYAQFEQDILNINQHLSTIKQSGILNIYTDDNFDFYNVNKDTFKFSKIEATLTNIKQSQIYGDVPRIIVNQILKKLEDTIKEDKQIEEVSLQFSKADFDSQYKDLLQIAEIAIKYDLINKVKNLNTEEIGDLIKNVHVMEALKDALTMIQYIKFPIVEKLKHYLGDVNLVVAVFYLCDRLFDAMNDWLVEFKQTEFFAQTKEFLKGKALI
jgi:hypothetical protein